MEEFFSGSDDDDYEDVASSGRCPSLYFVHYQIGRNYEAHMYPCAKVILFVSGVNVHHAAGCTAQFACVYVCDAHLH